MPTPALTFRTNFTPPITLNPFSKSEVKEAGFSFSKLLQPSVDGVLPIIGEVHYAPNGEPSGYGVALVAVVAALALYGTYKLIAR